jgi:peptidoglycan/xylan/chitin deacetylase (PgdA/CDA1 family)
MTSSSILDRARSKLAGAVPTRRVVTGRSRGVLSICFDDVPKTAWTVGGAVLRDHGVLGTYFIVGGLCGQYFEGRQQFDEADLGALHEAGHEVGCHLFEHVSPLRLSTAALTDSIARNALFVRTRLGEVEMTNFAYPYGEVSLSAKRTCARHFTTSRGVVPGPNEGQVELAHLKAYRLEARLAGEVDWESEIQTAIMRKSWLIVLTHDVDEYPSPYGCRPAELDRILGMARRGGLDILPVRSAFAAQ